MLRITFPYLLLISLTALSGSILNTYDNFSVPAFTPVLLNISIILSAIFLSQYLATPIMALAWGVLIGGVAQLFFQIPFLLKIKKLPKIQFGHHEAITTLKKRMIPALFGVSVSQINLLIDTMIASTLDCRQCFLVVLFRSLVGTTIGANWNRFGDCCAG